MSPVKQIPIGSIATRAMLVDLDVSFWEGFRRDKKISGEVADKYRTEGNYNKRLVPKEHLKDLTTALHTVVKIHKQMTLPWANSGARIISSELVLKYRDAMQKAIQAFDSAKTEFVQRYSWIMDDKAVTDLSFDAEEWPENIASKYGIAICYFPVPQGSDLRIDLSKDALTVIQKSINTDQQSRVENAVLDIANRVRQMVGRMVERLNEYKPPKNGGKAEGTFRDSLVSNIAELADLLPGLNITGDPKIDAMAAELKALATVKPDVLRDDEKQRLKTAKQAKEILDRVSDFI